jgi:hypothetical protein
MTTLLFINFQNSILTNHKTSRYALNMRRNSFLILFFLIFLGSTAAWAAKQRPPRGTKRDTPVKRTASTSRGVKTSVRFRSDRRGLIVSFGNFGSAVSVTYSLTYNSNGIPQGVRGTVTPTTAGGQRELLFGTCSHGVCRYHTNITNARLVIDSKLDSGLTIRKPYRIKV